MRHIYIKLITALFLVLALSAGCSSKNVDTGSADTSNTSNGGGGTGGGTQLANNIVTTATPSTITFAGTSTITAVVTDINGSPIPDGTKVSFSVDDSSLGTLSNSYSTTAGGTGTAIITFTAAKKAGTITISAVSGAVTKTTRVIIVPAATGSIQFVSASPQILGIKGSGKQETSVVTFKVLDIHGDTVIDGTSVQFSMQGPGGGAYIGATLGSTTSSGSTVNGVASVILNSGSTAGPVTIIASTTITGGSTISTSTGQISIGGGVPSASHWNLATTKFNLPGLLYSDKQATITAYIADRFGNYNVLKGTTISFRTEAGAIDTSATTDDTGKASVIFRTQAPSPLEVPPALAGDAVSVLHFNSNAEPYTVMTGTHNPRDGWITVLASTMGEEAFLDENGDGLFTRSYSTSPCPAGYRCECDGGVTNGYSSFVDGPTSCASGRRSEGFIDIGEPFVDSNDDGIWSGPTEQFIDINGNLAYDGPNGVWDGPDCNNTNSPCLRSKMIFFPIRLQISGNPFLYTDSGTNCDGPSFSQSGTFEVAPAFINKGGTGSFTACIGDPNLNWIEPGSTIVPSATVGAVTLTNSINPVIDKVSTGPIRLSFNVAIPITDTTNNSTTVGVTITTASGYVLTYTLLVPLKAFAITTANPLPSWTSGNPGYSVTFTGTGGMPPYSWTATGLPTGLVLNSITGALTGTPSPAGTYTVTVTMTDSNTWFTSKTFSLTIN